MMKKVIAVLATCMMLFSSASADVYYCFGDEVNIRETASTRHARIGYISFGQEVEIDYFKDGWAHSPTIQTEEVGGWIAAEWLSAEMPELVDNEVYVVNARRVNVRKMPNGKQIKRVGEGHKMTVSMLVCDSEGEWWAKTTESWIMYKFLDKE